MATLPEELVKSITDLIKAYEKFQQCVEDLQSFSNEVQGQMNRLVARKESLDTIGLSGKVNLPRAIQPKIHPVEKPEEPNVA